MKTFFLVLILAFTPQQTPKSTDILGPDMVPSYRLVRLQAKGDFDSVIWDVEPSETVDIGQESGPDLIFTGPPGKYIVKAITIKGGILGKARKIVTIQGLTPDPIPNPPVPPVPPDPTPPVPPTPAGLRVLFIYESSANMNKEQLNILSSTTIRDFLNKNTIKDSDGRPAYRYYDKDVDNSKDLPAWQSAWAAAKGMLNTVPSVVIFNGTKGELFPLPATEADTLTLLKKYTGGSNGYFNTLPR